MTNETTTLEMHGTGSSLARELAIGLAGAAALGAAAGSGHGAAMALRGAALAPLLFFGGAALALPPMVLCGTWAGSRAGLSDLVRHTGDTLGALGRALLGLAAPAAFLSATVRTRAGVTALGVVLAIAGLGAVLRQARALRSEGETPHAWLAIAAWGTLAIGVGLRLMVLLSRHLGGAA